MTTSFRKFTIYHDRFPSSFDAMYYSLQLKQCRKTSYKWINPIAATI